MQHLPLPLNPIVSAVEIPCLTTKRYDGGEFMSYPDRQNWGPRPIGDWLYLFENPTEEFHAFLQRWLFFGLIEAVAGQPINPFDFIERVGYPPRLVITTKRLSLLLMACSNTLRLLFSRSMNSAGVQALMRAVSVAMRFHQGFNRRMQERWPRDEVVGLLEFVFDLRLAEDPRDPRIAMSTAALAELVQAMLFNSQNDIEENVENSNFTNMVFPEWNGFVYRRMRSMGWCPSELSRLFGTLNAAGLYYISHIQRPDHDRTHAMIRVRRATSPAKVSHGASNAGRSLCTPSQCTIRQLHEDSYQTKHAEGCSGCYEMVADENEVLEILKGGSIPLILSIDSTDQSRAINLVASESDMGYVAISHVWSDGLGNVHRSALPVCQMLRLSSLIRGLPGKASNSVLFWIDTIGCPPDSAGQDEAQQLAISMMRKTYENASAVLVLDSWLQPQPITNMSDIEILIRVISSGWNSRLWTLQEGALARTLFFQFSDAAYDIDEGADRLMKQSDFRLEFTLKRMILQRLRDIRFYKNSKNFGAEAKLLKLANVLNYRSTSVSTDEALCLGTLMDLDVLQIVQTPPEERMVKFWSMLDSVPYHFLARPYPRLKVKGYRWAPQTLLWNKHRSTLKKDYSGFYAVGMLSSVLSILSPGKITNQGLLLRGEGLIFHMEGRCIADSFYLRDQNGDWYNAAPHLVPIEGAESFDINRYRLNPQDLYGNEIISIIFGSIPGYSHSMTTNALYGKEDWYDPAREIAIMGLVEGEADGIINVKRITYSPCRKLDKERSKELDAISSPTFKAGSSTREAFPCQKRPLDQRWYLD